MSRCTTLLLLLPPDVVVSTNLFPLPVLLILLLGVLLGAVVLECSACCCGLPCVSHTCTPSQGLAAENSSSKPWSFLKELQQHHVHVGWLYARADAKGTSTSHLSLYIPVQKSTNGSEVQMHSMQAYHATAALQYPPGVPLI